MIQIKRAYEAASKKDGYRVLVDRLWPRGLKKEDLKYDEWLKDVAPSTALRKEFSHDPARWKSFVSAYKKELKSPETQELIRKLSQHAAQSNLTLLYGARDEEHNNAVVLKELLEKASPKNSKKASQKRTEKSPGRGSEKTRH